MNASVATLEPAKDMVNAIWKWVAMVAVGIIIGGAPGYVSLVIDHHNMMTQTSVDQEIDNREGGLKQSVDDLRDQMNDMQGEIHELLMSQKK